MLVFDNNTIYEGIIRIPHIDLDGNYRIRGRLWNQEIDQSGPFNASLGKIIFHGFDFFIMKKFLPGVVDLIVKVYIDIILKKGVEYLSLEEVVADFKIVKPIGHFENFFGENQVLSEFPLRKLFFSLNFF